MTTALYTHPSSLEHDTGADPERIARIEAVNEALAGVLVGACSARRTASHRQLKRVHDGGYVDLVLDNIPEGGLARLDADTVLSPGRATLHCMPPVRLSPRSTRWLGAMPTMRSAPSVR